VAYEKGETYLRNNVFVYFLPLSLMWIIQHMLLMFHFNINVSVQRGLLWNSASKNSKSEVVSYMGKNRNRILISFRYRSLQRNSPYNTNTLSWRHYRNETRRLVTALTRRQFQELRHRILPDIQLRLHCPPTDITSISTVFSQFRSVMHKYVIFRLPHE
jgi:hypothetical protein